MAKKAASKDVKIFILGGCAKMAVPALRELANEDDVSEVMLADLNEEAAKNLANSMGTKFKGTSIDATNHSQLVNSIKDYDVVMGYVGPFYLFEKPIVEACIEAKTHYVSIGDDYDAYLSVEPLFAEAETAGVTIITGLGNSPGITNLLAKKGYYSMDNPEKIHVNWTGGSDEEVGPANIKHVMHIFAGTTPQWIDGKEVRVPCGGGEKTVEFPEPVGINTVFYTGHAESVTLPRNLKGLKEVTLHGGAKPVWVARLASFFGDVKLSDTHKKRDKLANLLTPVLGLFKIGGTADKSVFRIDVHGTHKGVERHHFYSGVGHIAEITSMPCVEGALMVARGELNRKGVFASEAIIDPEVFLPRIAKRGVEMMYYEGTKEA